MTKTSKGTALVVAAAILLSGGVMTVGTATPAQAATVAEAASVAEVQRILDDTNAYRAQNGLPLLLLAPSMNTVAQAWSKNMASQSYMYHNPDFSTQLPSGWTGLAENVAYGYSHSDVTNAWINSPGHRANIVGNYTHIGIGIAYNDYGRPYYTQNFGRYITASTPAMIGTPTNTVGQLQFTSSWAAQTGVKDYIVQVWRPDGSLLQTKTTTDPKITYTGLAANTTYTVGVTARAVDGAGMEYRSPVKKYNVTTLLNAPVTVVAPNAPTGLKVATLTYNEATLSWVAPTGVVGDITGYTVIVKQTGKADRMIKSVTPTLKITGLTENSSYTALVVANVASKDRTKTAISPAASLIMKTPVSSASTVKVEKPVSLVTAAGRTTITATWKAPAVTGTLTGYYVTIRQGTTLVKGYTTTGTKASFTGLEPNAEYTVSVKAKASSSNGLYKASSSAAMSTLRTLP